MKEPLILIGGGGHCRSCIDVIEQQGSYHIAGIVDLPERKGESVFSYPVIGNDDDLATLIQRYKNALITIGHIKSPLRRIELFDKIEKLNGVLPVIISPRAYVSKHSTIGEGTIVLHNAVINAGATVGKNCIINTGAIIEHDVIIENNCHISTGAIVNGAVKIRGKYLFWQRCGIP